MAKTNKKPIADDLLTGLRNYWYPILRSQDLGSEEPVGITRVGEKLAVWRDSSGQPRVFADRCAHRAAPLSMGRLRGNDRIECRYHGLRYDGSGQCRLVPTEHEGEDGPMSRELRVRTYPVEEKGGVIWSYIGDPDKVSPPPLEIEPELTDPDYEGAIETYVWEANWLLTWDNGVDPAHVPFLHAGSPLLPPDVAVVDEIKAERTEAGILVSRVGVSDDERWAGQTFDAVEFVLPCLGRLYVPLPDGGSPVRILQYMLPIDEGSTMVIVYFGRKMASEEERSRWRQMYEGFIWPAVQEVFRQDSEICLAQGDIREALETENLIASDAGLPLVRKHILQAYEEQQRAMASTRSGGTHKPHSIICNQLRRRMGKKQNGVGRRKGHKAE